jgi:hypothetical protein
MPSIPCQGFFQPVDPGPAIQHQQSRPGDPTGEASLQTVPAPAGGFQNGKNAGSGGRIPEQEKLRLL